MKNKSLLVSLIIIMITAGLCVFTGCGNDNNENKEKIVNSNSNNVENQQTEQKEEKNNSSSVENKKEEQKENKKEEQKEEKKEEKNVNTNSNSVKVQEKDQSEGYEINVSKKEITIEKGKEASFDITFTNPDESSIREYIHCDDQNDIVIVKYSALENKKITVDVEALKAGATEITVCDYNYPDVKEIVKVNVVDKD